MRSLSRQNQHYVARRIPPLDLLDDRDWETLNQTMPLLQPDRVTGCQSMINTMRVISESGRKIEELYPYNVAAQFTTMLPKTKAY